MMTRKRVGLLALAIMVLVIGVYALQRVTSERSDHRSWSTVQAPSEREWIPSHVDLLDLHEPISRHLVQPVGDIRVRGDTLFVADFGDGMRIKQFATDGRLLGAIGNGPGEGPGEIQHATHFHVRDGEVWVADSRARAISRFKTDGTFLDRFNVEQHPMRVTESRGRVVLLRMGPAGLFQILDPSGTVIRTFGTLVSDQTKNFMALGGHVLEGPSGGFIYVPSYASHLYYFDAEGEIERVVQTGDRREFPSVHADASGGGVRYHAPDPPVKNLRASVSGEVLYLHVHFRRKQGESYQVLDRYDWKTGTYINSVRLPIQVLGITVHEDRLYCTGDTTVYAFRFEMDAG